MWSAKPAADDQRRGGRERSESRLDAANRGVVCPQAVVSPHQVVEGEVESVRLCADELPDERLPRLPGNKSVRSPEHLELLHRPYRGVPEPVVRKPVPLDVRALPRDLATAIAPGQPREQGQGADVAVGEIGNNTRSVMLESGATISSVRGPSRSRGPTTGPPGEGASLHPAKPRTAIRRIEPAARRPRVCCRSSPRSRRDG